MVDTYTDLLLRENINVEELDYGCGPSSAPMNVEVDRYEVNEGDQDCEDDGGNEDGDDESDGDVQVDRHFPSFLTINQLMENEQGGYLSMDAPSCDVLNNPDPEDLDERGTVYYYLAPSPQFENVENFGNAVSSDWTPWVNYNIYRKLKWRIYCWPSFYFQSYFAICC